MKRTDSIPRWLILLMWIGAVLLLTTLPRSFPGIRTIARLLGGSDVNDAIGHGFLFASLTVVLYWALRWRLRFAFAFWLTIALVLVLSTGTEYAQQFASGRTVSLSDLLANWVGIFAAATVISFWSRTRMR